MHFNTFCAIKVFFSCPFICFNYCHKAGCLEDVTVEKEPHLRIPWFHRVQLDLWPFFGGRKEDLLSKLFGATLHTKHKQALQSFCTVPRMIHRCSALQFHHLGERKKKTMLLKIKSGYVSYYLFNNLQIILSTTKTNYKFKDKFRFYFSNRNVCDFKKWRFFFSCLLQTDIRLTAILWKQQLFTGRAYWRPVLNSQVCSRCYSLIMITKLQNHSVRCHLGGASCGFSREKRGKQRKSDAKLTIP